MASIAVDSNEKPDAKITLHWLDKSRAQRILWLFEELNLSYNIEVYKRDANNLAPASLKKIHPLGKSPIVSVQAIDESSEPRVIVESGAIVEYITEYFGRDLIPQRWQEGKENKIGGETQEWLRYRHFMHYAEGSLMGLMVLSIVMGRIRSAPLPFFLKPITRTIANKVDETFLNKEFSNHYSFLEEQLATSEGDYLCGKGMTGADILVQFPLEAGRDALPTGLTKDKYPKICAYVDRLTSRDAYKRAMERIKKETGKYDRITDA